MNPINSYAGAFVPGVLAGWLGTLLIPLAIWGIFWQGIALWKAAKDGSKVWFIVLLLIHTLGILDLLYIFVFSKNPGVKTPKAAKKH